MTHKKGKKIPKGYKKALQVGQSYLVWDTGAMDMEGPWSWKGIDPNEWWDHIFPARTGFASMTWNEILGDRHHAVGIDQIIPRARRRLEEIEHDDVDALYSLAITGIKRIWGIRTGPVFKILWWDPRHEICPSIKRHT